MLDTELVKQILLVSMASGCVTTLTVQKIKEQVKTKKYLGLISVLVSMVVGTLFSKSFSDMNWVYCLWSGFFTWVDANMVYSILEDRIFTKFENMQKTIHLERND
jgi:uncharacterized membrane protein